MGEKGHANAPSCVCIAVAAPVRSTFSYSVPQPLLPFVRVGCRVRVPFRHRPAIGYVIGKDEAPSNRPLKDITDIIDTNPLFPAKMVPFFKWMADYYLHPVGMVIHGMVPGTGFKSAKLTPKGTTLLKGNLFDSETLQRLTWIRDHPDEKPPWPLKVLYPLQKEGYILLEHGMRKASKQGPFAHKWLKFAADMDTEKAHKRQKSPLRADNEAEFLQLIFDAGSLPVSDIKTRFSNGTYLIRKWVKKGVLEWSTPPEPLPLPDPDPPPAGSHSLNFHQQQVLRDITERLDQKTFGAFLLYGITGSGKTEVYLRAILHCISTGRQAILMAPEILLADYLETTFRRFLGERMAVYHSNLGKNERTWLWSRMASGNVDLVIGARSALFAPLPHLGLIVVDEEHDSAYVQTSGSGGTPRYNARDLAVVRARQESAAVLLGSGTPSVQSFQNTKKKRYELLSMPKRIQERSLPAVEIVDMRKIKDAGGKEPAVSPKLYQALKENLSNGNQAILFLNRRGFHRLFICRSCGQPLRCPNCDVSLTFHLQEDRLACHYCGFRANGQVPCTACGSRSLKPFGLGTEKLEFELSTLFPDAHISRMDTDSTRKKGSAQKILKQFARKETQILLGTQMITKGYDFPHVTLVGVIAADLTLGFPDFRAGEKTFQLLSQVAGRAGRGDQKGRVIIQTFNPNHYVIQTAMNHDFRGFFERETHLRKTLRYPPFSHLACLKLQGADPVHTKRAVQELGKQLSEMSRLWTGKGREIQLLGPVEAPLSRLKGQYRWQMLVKCVQTTLLKRFVLTAEQMFQKQVHSGAVRLRLDMDPYDML